MAMAISELQIDYGDPYLYSIGFRNLIENHIGVIKAHQTTTYRPLTGHIEIVWRGDFYGLLQAIGVPQDLFWITLRVNDLHSSIDYSGDKQVILIPSLEYIKNLLQTYLNSTTLR